MVCPWYWLNFSCPVNYLALSCTGLLHQPRQLMHSDIAAGVYCTSAGMVRLVEPQQRTEVLLLPL